MRKKRKLIPVEMWQLGKVESWLTEQGQNGLQLEKFNSLFATFLQSEPQQVEYLMIVMPKKDRPPTNTEELALEGWEFVASREFYHIFRSQKADATSEIEPDLMKQAQAVTGILKQARNQFFINLGMVVVGIIIGALLMFKVVNPIEYFVEGLSMGFFAMIFSSSCLTVNYLRDYLGILRMKRQLEQGIALDYRAYWQVARLKKLIWHVSYTAVILIGFAVLVKQIYVYNSLELTQDTTDIPVLRLHMIEPQERQPNLAQSVEEDWSNWVITNWTLVAPVQYETIQRVSILQENEAVYTPTLTYKVVECIVPSLASALYDEFKQTYYVEGEARSVEAFDQVFFEQLYDDHVRLLTLKDKQVQYVDYTGEADIEDVLQALNNL